jgi:hypothetical protein
MNFFENSKTVDDSTFNALSVIKRNLKRHQNKIEETSFHPKLRFK